MPLEPNAVETWFGAQFAALHPRLQALHREGGTLAGPVHIEFGNGTAAWIGRRMARRLGVPCDAGEHRLEVLIRSTDGKLHWDRRFDASAMFRSTFTPVGSYPDGYWIEQSGAVQLLLGVQVIRGAWHWRHHATRLRWLPLPRAVLPSTHAYKEFKNDRYHFDVAIQLPLVGMVLRYHGKLELSSNL